MATITINGYTFTKINGTSKRGEHIISAYHNSTANMLKHIYKNPSDWKRHAMRCCYELMGAVAGSYLWITGANCHSFSVAFFVENEDKHYLIYLTRNGQYAVTLDNEGK